MTKKKTPEVPKPGTAITNSHITVYNAANEHTRAAVEALAHAASENARAIAAIAGALKGGEAVGIKITN